MLVQCCELLLATETRQAASLRKGSFGIESDRPADYRRLSGGDHAVRAAVSQTAADHAGLLSRRPQHSVVGNFAVDCGGGDEHVDHHQYSGPRLQFESYFS